MSLQLLFHTDVFEVCDLEVSQEEVDSFSVQEVLKGPVLLPYTREGQLQCRVACQNTLSPLPNVLVFLLLCYCWAHCCATVGRTCFYETSLRHSVKTHWKVQQLHPLMHEQGCLTVCKNGEVFLSVLNEKTLAGHEHEISVAKGPS